MQQKKVELAYVEEGFAVVDGLAAGARVVVEGAQNLRPGSAVAEAQSSDLGSPDAAKGDARKGKRKADKAA